MSSLIIKKKKKEAKVIYLYKHFKEVSSFVNIVNFKCE